MHRAGRTADFLASFLPVSLPLKANLHGSLLIIVPADSREVSYRQMRVTKSGLSLSDKSTDARLLLMTPEMKASSRVPPLISTNVRLGQIKTFRESSKPFHVLFRVGRVP